MIVNRNLENAGKVFIDSLGKQVGTHQVYKQMIVTQEFKIDAKVIDEVFEDGAPVLFKFDMGAKTETYTFEPGRVFDFIDQHYQYKTYWFDNGKWYLANIDCDDLMEEIEAE